MRRRLGFGLDSGWVLDTQKLTTVPSFKSMVTGCKPDLLKPDLYVRSIASDKLKQPVITEKYKCEDTKKRKIFELKDICGVVCCVVFGSMVLVEGFITNEHILLLYIHY